MSKTLKKVMDELTGTYRPGSGVWQSVEKGLKKLSSIELGQLWAMLITRRAPGQATIRPRHSAHAGSATAQAAWKATSMVRASPVDARRKRGTDMDGPKAAYEMGKGGVQARAIAKAEARWLDGA